MCLNGKEQMNKLFLQNLCILMHSSIWFAIRPKRKCLVSGYPAGYLSLFLDCFKDFHTFSIQKSFYKKNFCLPTDHKNFGHVTGNKAYFYFGLINLGWLIVYTKGSQVSISKLRHTSVPVYGLYISRQCRC